MSFYLPEGTAYKETRRQVKIAEGYILKKYKKEIKNFAIYIGKGGARFHSATGAEQESTNYAQFVINNHNLKQTMKMIQELKPYFENNFADANAIIKVLESGPPVGAPIQIDVYGKDFDKLYAYTKTIQKELEKLQGVRNIRDNWGDLIPKLSIQVNQDQARRIGVSTHSISNALAAAFSGNRITDFREGDNSIPIIMRLNKLERANLKSIQNLTITTSQGNRVPLLQVVNIAMEWEAGKIRHKERKRTITIEAYVSEGASGKEILKLLEQRVKEKVKFEIGYGVNFGGEGKKSKEANDSIMKQVPIAFALMLLILVAQFGNVRKMLVILMTIPLSFMGVIFGLLLVDYPFGFMSFLGVISLAGIVVNNAILLLEQAGADVKAGKSELEAIISAGQRRAFPIILTTITTILGLLPLAFSGEMWGSLAVTIMGGLLISTILTLVVIPVIYSILFGVKYKAATS
ncbi:MAG: multidrug efflux pump [bacterium]